MAEITATDALGRPIRVPANYRGTPESFVELVKQLEPHHCSYPNGQTIDGRSGKPCTCAKTKEGVCKRHSVEKLPGVINNAPEGIRTKLIEAYNDLKLTDTRPNIAIDDFILGERLKMLSTGESVKFIEHLQTIHESLNRASEELNAAIADGDPKTVAIKIKQLSRGIRLLNKVISDRLKHHNALDSVSAANASNMRSKEAASRVAVNEKQVISYENAVMTIRELCETFQNVVNEVVSSADERARIQAGVTNRVYSLAGRFHEN